MSAWLRALLGLDENEIPPEGEEAIWEFSGLPEGDAFFFSVAIVVLSIFFIILLYRREKSLGILQRITLSGLRLGALALVILILLNPRLITEMHHERQGKTLVILDHSASMAQQDTFDSKTARALQRTTGLALSDKPSRWELVEAALHKNKLLEKLGEKNDVHVFALGEKVERLSELEKLSESSIQGHQTAIGDGILEAVRQTGSDLLAGVVLITDGRNNSGLNPVEMARNPVAYGRWPVYGVGVGKQKILKNYTVVDIVAPSAVEVGFPVQVEAKVRLSGIKGPVRATLTRSDRNGKNKETVEERFLEPKSLLLESHLKFIDILPEKGAYVYKLEIPYKQEETQRRDNVRTVQVQASEERHRVLFISGSPSYEYIFANAFFLRDPGIQVSTWLTTQDPRAPRDGDLPIKELPKTALQMRAYDIVVMLDPDPEALPREFSSALLEFVSEQGGGLVYIAGEINTPKLAVSNLTTTLRKLLPVTLGRKVFNARDNFTQPWRPRLTAMGLEHPIFHLEDTEEENQRVWEKLPPFYFVYPNARLKPSGKAVLAGPKGEVLGAIHQAGMGDSLYLGSDDFHRLRHAGRGLHERFWAGTLRFMAQGKKRAGLREITVESDRDRYTVGEQAQIFLHIREGNENALRPPHQEIELAHINSIDSELEPNEGNTLVTAKEQKNIKIRLYQTPGNKDRYTGFFRTKTPGDYGIVFEERERSTFRVNPISNEFEDPSPNYETIEDLSSSSGGVFLRLDQINDLNALIADASVKEVIGRRAATLWDSAFLMCLFCGLLILEWVLRKMWHLN